jgi:hypothetical protein
MLTFTRNGKTIESIDGGSAHTRSVDTSLSAFQGKSAVWTVPVDGGPLLALLWSREVPHLLGPSEPDLFVMAYAPKVEDTGEVVEVRVEGGELVVRRSGSGEILPLGFLERVGEFGNVWNSTQKPCLAYFDDGEERHFQDLPIGTVVQLVSPAAGFQGAVISSCRIESFGRISIDWPPR